MEVQKLLQTQADYDALLASEGLPPDIPLLQSELTPFIVGKLQEMMEESNQLLQLFL